ncbi:MAG: hypothetical protein HQM10_24615 [Candidatus Riflebacteria bacterium]|nr:hypothetical protein [Candidatus Riflebacteria bacterium]
MKGVSVIYTLLFFFGICHCNAEAIFAGEDLAKQVTDMIKNQLKKTLLEKYIKYDKTRNIVSFSPELMKFAADKAIKTTGSDLQALNLNPEGNALNFSLALKNGTNLSTKVVPEALELSPQGMSLLGKLPNGIDVKDVNIKKTLTGFFDNLFGSSPASSQSARTTPTNDSPGINITDIVKNFSVKGDTFCLSQPLKSSALGRALSNAMTKNSDVKSASTTQRLPLVMENGWLNLNLGDINSEKILIQFASEILARQIQGE